MDLSHSDSWHLRAADGWSDLGLHTDAVVELDGISPAGQKHAAVMVMQGRIHAEIQDWSRCVELGEALVRRHPREIMGWLNRAYALHELRRTQDAWDALHPALEKFPKNWLIPYNLACYACQLGRSEDALHLLRAAMGCSDSKSIRLQALTDPDLKPLWPQISGLT